MSSAQVNDSHVVLYLFSDPSFRQFLDNQKTFLQQSVPRHMSSKEANSFSLATVSLHRSLDDDWISSTFDDSETSKTMARVILEDGMRNSGVVDLERQIDDKDSGYNKAVKRWPEHERLLKGMLHSIAYFAVPGKTSITEYDGDRSDLYSILHETIDALNESELVEEDKTVKERKKRIQKTIEFIDKHIKDESKRQYKSDVFDALRTGFDLGSSDYQIIGEPVHHAWSAAVQRDTNTDCGSLGHLSNQGVQVGLYLGRPTDSLVPRVTEGKDYSTSEFSKKIRGIINWDPARLSWTEISLIAEATKKTATQFQNSLVLESGPEIDNASVRHVEALNHFFRELAQPRGLATYPLVFNNWIWIFSGLIAIVLGYAHEFYSNIPDSGLLTKEAIHRALEIALYHGEGSIMTDITFSRAANRMRFQCPS